MVLKDQRAVDGIRSPSVQVPGNGNRKPYHWRRCRNTIEAQSAGLTIPCTSDGCEQLLIPVCETVMNVHLLDLVATKQLLIHSVDDIQPAV